MLRRDDVVWAAVLVAEDEVELEGLMMGAVEGIEVDEPACWADATLLMARLSGSSSAGRELPPNRIASRRGAA